MGHLVVLLFTSAMLVYIVEAGFDSAMSDRFRVWFTSLDTNHDHVLSMADLDNCTSRYEHAGDPSTVRLRCEQYLPMWMRYVILNGWMSITVDDFLETFRSLRRERVGKFETTIARSAAIFWNAIDMNNDRYITHVEDNCVAEGQRIYWREMKANFLDYILRGQVQEPISDPSCPWV